jgi:hypothetical protein
MCTCILLRNAVSDTDCIVLNVWMIIRNEFERVCKGMGVWKKAVMAQFKVLFWYK